MYLPQHRTRHGPRCALTNNRPERRSNAPRRLVRSIRGANLRFLWLTRQEILIISSNQRLVIALKWAQWRCIRTNPLYCIATRIRLRRSPSRLIPSLYAVISAWAIQLKITWTISVRASSSHWHSTSASGPEHRDCLKTSTNTSLAYLRASRPTRSPRNATSSNLVKKTSRYWPIWLVLIMTMTTWWRVMPCQPGRLNWLSCQVSPPSLLTKRSAQLIKLRRRKLWQRRRGERVRAPQSSYLWWRKAARSKNSHS